MLLSVNDLHVYYGAIHAVKGVSLEVNEGEIVTLIGANGAGKTTTLDTIAGLLRSRGGDIVFQGESIAQMQEKYPYFLTWRPGDHTRIAGKMQLHYRLAFDAEGGRCFRCLTLAGILSAPSRTLCMTRATWRTLTPRRRTTSTTSCATSA